MPSYQRVAALEPWKVVIEWTRPTLYKNARSYADDADAWLYMIVGSFGTYERRIFYIGKTVDQYVMDRLNQPDHRRRYAKLKRVHPRHQLLVSLGKLHVQNGNITEARVDQVETMLIYTANCLQPHLINRNKIWVLRTEEPYFIKNTGYRRPLPSEIHHGLFIR